ncbi:MAG: serine O-acetyltransferase [Planctomycetota bacterium]
MTLTADRPIAKVPRREADPTLDAQRGTGALDQNPPGLSLWKLWKEDLASHGGDWTRPGFRAVAVHRFGNWRMGKSKLLRILLSPLYRWAFRRCRNRYGIELPYAAKIGRRFIIEHQSAIVVHGHCVIGDDCTIRQGVTLGNKTPNKPHDAPTLGNRVNVGAGAKVLGAVTLGDGVMVGANAVVVKDVPTNHIAVGIPAQCFPNKT